MILGARDVGENGILVTDVPVEVFDVIGRLVSPLGFQHHLPSGCVYFFQTPGTSEGVKVSTVSF